MPNLEEVLIAAGEPVLPLYTCGREDCARACRAFEIEVVDDQWVCSACLHRDRRAAEPAPVLTMDDVRAERTARLRICDWTQLEDVPDDVKLPAQPYRQALRDFPETLETEHPDLLDDDVVVVDDICALPWPELD
jgi:hypothetical protein